MRNKYDASHVMYRDGVYYYVRRIPCDLASFYSVKRLCFSLKTKSLKAANRSAASISQRLDDYWLGLRLQKLDIPAIHLTKQHESNTSVSPALSDACDLYLRLKGIGKDKVFKRTAKRNTAYVIEVLGDRPLDTYSSSDAATFRDWLIRKGMTMKTVKRVFASVRAIVNLTISEEGLGCSNAFARTYFPAEINPIKRKPIPLEDIQRIQTLCLNIDDDMRWLIALISDTGMRLGEAAGLHLDDIRLNEAIPHIYLKPHPWRSLKTKGSERRIPLVGVALWAAERIVKNGSESKIAFPRYCNEFDCNVNSASNGLNKWLRNHVPQNCVIHSFRHSLRERLRAVECPTEVVDAIGGWQVATVGQRYGDGYQLDVLLAWLMKIKLH